MFLRVLMDVGHQLNEVSIRRNFNAPEGVLEETSSASVGFVNCLGVGVEKIAELLAGVFTDPKGFPKPFGSGPLSERLGQYRIPHV
jgi:hypothetical protein